MKFFEVFKAGNYPQGVFSQSDIETLAKNYDPNFCEAPITLDHEQKGPAYGWVSELKSENGKLKACFRNVAPELKDFVQSGKYKKISVEIYKEIDGKKPYLKAVSFLGAGIPQVKGMEPVEFKEGESETYIFELEADITEQINEDAQLLKANEELVKLQNKISELESQVVLFTDLPVKNEYSELISKLQEKVQKLSVQVVKMQDESCTLQKTKQELSKLRQEIKMNEFEEFLDAQVNSGSLHAFQKEPGLKILKALDNLKKFDESDYVEEFKEFIKTYPKRTSYKSFPDKENRKTDEQSFLEFSNADEDSLSIYKEAKHLSEKEKIPFKDALIRLYV